ncbi:MULTISPECIES: glycosyltransferase family 39 protein [unclassified Anabaena]|uniref:glycosyltransferase family 39 protein n=1 Tax=unclassified Anabaena TaxID=2619674 RepID=UPI0039C6EE37
MRNFALVPSWLRFLIIFVLTMGILFRFVNLEGKIYSHNETYTSLRISGYTVNEVKQQIFNGRVISRENFAKFQSRNEEKNFSDTIMSLATEDPQHPPLYYLIARFWVGIFGNSITAIRSLSAVISLLVFPGIYWLCRELFNVPLSVPGLAIALVAISPIHLVYAQEAREYILWLVTVIFCSASLLLAIRIQSKDHNELAPEQQISDSFTPWGIYVVTLTLSFYTCLWSVFVAVAHGIYVIIISRFQLTETVRAYLIASALAFLAFLPWIMIVAANFLEFLLTADVTQSQSSISSLILVLLIQISRIFFDLNLDIDNLFSSLIAPFFLTLVGYAIYFLCRTTNYQVWLFILMLMIIMAIPIKLPNLNDGGIVFSLEAYLIPLYLGIQLAVAYLLATQLYNGIVSRRRIWQMILILVIVCGLISCRVSYEAETWWHKGVSFGNAQVARIINETENPLLISDAEGINYGNVFSLSYLVQPNVRFQLIGNQAVPDIPDSFSDIFLLNPSDSRRSQIIMKYKSNMHIVYQDRYSLLWKLSKLRASS